MPLIEGLGDEVTVILVLLTIIIVLLIAWLSTHTRDIPFFSVIVVELSQRAARNRRQNDEAQQQPVPSSGTEAIPSSETESVLQSETDIVPSPGTESGPQLGTDGKHINDTTSLSANSELTEEISTNRQNDLQAETRTDDSSRNTQSIVSEHLSHTEDGHAHVREDGKSESITLMGNVLGTGTSTMKTISHANRSMSSDVPMSGHSATEPVLQSDSDSSVRQRNVPSPGVTSPPSNATAVNDNSTVHDSDTEEHQGQIRIRLKYLNDTQRLVYSSPSDTIGQFRRTHFSTELASNKLVRLIYNGQDMRIDTNTLQRYNITDNSVVHCLVTQNLQGTAQPQPQNGDADVQLGSFMLPLFALVLGAIWYLRVTQRQYFNAVSTLSLAGLTFLFMLGCMSVWRGQGHRGEEHHHLD